jgi:hypothetical protein
MKITLNITWMGVGVHCSYRWMIYIHQSVMRRMRRRSEEYRVGGRGQREERGEILVVLNKISLEIYRIKTSIHSISMYISYH